MNSQNLRLAEVEDFSGRQTFQVGHDPKNLVSFRSVVRKFASSAFFALAKEI